MASDWAASKMPAEHGGCQACGRTDVTLKKDGTLRHHVHEDAKGSAHVSPYGSRCEGSGKPPKTVQDAPEAEDA